MKKGECPTRAFHRWTHGCWCSLLARDDHTSLLSRGKMKASQFNPASGSVHTLECSLSLQIGSSSNLSFFFNIPQKNTDNLKPGYQRTEPNHISGECQYLTGNAIRELLRFMIHCGWKLYHEHLYDVSCIIVERNCYFVLGSFATPKESFRLRARDFGPVQPRRSYRRCHHTHGASSSPPEADVKTQSGRQHSMSLGTEHLQNLQSPSLNFRGF